jgi:small-conductance mechanosensitive channel
MKSFWIPIFIGMTALMFVSEVSAQEVPKPAVNEEAVKHLITTLESETARTEFIGNLKLLLEQQGQEEEESIAPITQTLGVESFTGEIVTTYQGFLARNNLKSSTVGKLALSILTTLLFLGLTVLLRRGITKGLGALDRFFKRQELPPLRLKLYSRSLRAFTTLFLTGLLAYTYLSIWVSARNNPLEAEWFKTGLKTVFNVAFVLFLAVIIWETISAVIQIVLRKSSGDNSTRTQTVMPIVRNVLFAVYAVLFVLMILSELGINIMPLLAGAGIVGVAIGFGAQAMVKDFLTGFTILMEDVIRVGDIAKVAGHEGTVEKITLRKIQLRDFGGRVYTIPFGEVKTIENSTKDFSFYPLEISVSYTADTDHVCKVLRDVDAGLRADPSFAGDILQELEIMGVDRFADSAVIIKARIKTQPLRQWVVGREFNRRMKKAFEAEGIEIPFPQRVVTVKNENR